MITIHINQQAGTFAENKDIARDMRLQVIIPTLKNGEEVILDFSGVDATTQSFIHALISDVLRTFGTQVLDSIRFKDCNEVVKKIISIVVEYMQESQ